MIYLENTQSELQRTVERLVTSNAHLQRENTRLVDQLTLLAERHEELMKAVHGCTQSVQDLLRPLADPFRKSP